MAIHFNPAPLVINDPWQVLTTFFTLDGSSKYDTYIGSAVSPLNRITDDDVTAINASMSARSSHSDWQRLIELGAIPELSAVDPLWNLYTTTPEAWEEAGVANLLESLFAAVIGPGIGISRATKVLHIKRPDLIPVCDSYVLQLLGIPGESAASGVAAMVQLRQEGRRNLSTLEHLQERLANELKVSRTLVRIVDALIWGSHPDTWIAKQQSSTRVAADDGLPTRSA